MENSPGSRIPSDLTPALSIVIPLFNKEREIIRSVGSIVRQTATDWELIVVDDGSTDAGAGLVERFGDHRFSLHRQANAGVAAARNAGVARARGRLVGFLDADDEWDEDMVSTLLELGSLHPGARVLATGYRVRHSTADSVDVPVDGFAKLETGLLGHYFAVASRSSPPITSSSVAIDREALLAIGGFPAGLAAGEDLLTWARLAAHFPIAYTNRVHATLWAPADTTERPGRRPAEPDTVAAAIAVLEVPGRDLYLAHWHRMRGVHFLQLQEPRSARREFRLAIGRNPRKLVHWALLLVGLLPGAAAMGLYRVYKGWQRNRAQTKRNG